jgi:hypothetical protein
MKTKLFPFLAIAAIAFLFSCKGKDGAMGPAGPAGTSATSASNLPPITEGFAKGTATGTNLNGTTFSYNLDFEGDWSTTDNNYSYVSATQTRITISKSYSGQGDAFTDGNSDISMSFDVPDMNSLTTVSNIDFGMDTNKDLGNNNYQQISHFWNSNSPTGTGTVSNLNYNSSTGILTGSYSIDIPAASYSGSLTIANGTFSTKLSNVVYRMGI